VLDPDLDNALAGLVLTFALPLLACYTILTKLDSTRRAVFRQLGIDRGVNRVEIVPLKGAEQFEFERAIDAYEELIDSGHANGRH